MNKTLKRILGYDSRGGDGGGGGGGEGGEGRTSPHLLTHARKHAHAGRLVASD